MVLKKTKRLIGNSTMFQVLLVVPRFFLLDLKFLLHNHVSQHLNATTNSRAHTRCYTCVNERNVL